MGSKKILFLSPYPFNKAPSQRLKYEQYYPHFIKNGYSVTTSSFIDDPFWEIVYKPGNLFLKFWYTVKAYARRLKDLSRLGKYDVIYVHLWVTPLGLPIFEWLTRVLSKKLVYDIDDLIYLGHTTKSNHLIKNLKGKNKPLYLMKVADHVVVCTPKLDEFVKKYNLNTTDISSTIDTVKYLPKTGYEAEGKVVLGWSGSHSTSKYLYLLKNVFLALKKDMDFKLIVIGDPGFKIDGIEVEAVPWAYDSEVEDLKKIDIGLYPLPDEEWVYGKSGLKALQYMALGIPTIATAIGANFRVIENNVSGYLIPVNDDDAWISKIKKLSKDADLRRKVGIQARERVEKYYSIQSNQSKYLSVLSQVLEKS